MRTTITAARTLMLGLLATASIAQAQTSRLIPFEVKTGPNHVLHGSPWGPLDPANPNGPIDACSGVASHTDANFGGGSFVMQMGFAQGELLAATYTLAANEFPIRLDLAEVIFASIAPVETTTHWSILIFDGEPGTGVLVNSFSSDGDLLPHIVIPPASQSNPKGVNMQFSVDPNDPDQIEIMNVTGTNKFTIAWRIDKHNNQTGNPCFVAPDKNQNAFPTTDVSGLLSPTGNWLSGINCGPFGCPANGGWAKFSALPAGCKPSGDWVMRATWSSINCGPSTGACCLLDGTCQVMSATSCSSLGGTYKGDNSVCPGANCPQPEGACCFGNGNCLVLAQVQCNMAGGTYLGDGTTCAAGNTCPKGACCLINGLCIDGVTLSECDAQDGTFKGVGSKCDGVTCPKPTGACCLSNGNCLVLTQADCGVIPGSSWAGPLTTCAACEADCPADCDGDQALTIDDFVCFQTFFALGDPSADCDEDTNLTIDDFICYQTIFAIGC